jgi:WD40 repeat protein
LKENQYGYVYDAACNLKSKEGLIAIAIFDNVHIWRMAGQQLMASKDVLKNTRLEKGTAPVQEDLDIIQKFNIFIEEEIPAEAQKMAIVAPGKSHIALIKSDHSIESWKIFHEEEFTFRKLHTLTGHQSDINDVLFDHQGYLISTSRDGTTRVWDIKAGRLLWTIETDACEKLDLSEDGSTIFITGINDQVEVVQHLLNSSS